MTVLELKKHLDSLIADGLGDVVIVKKNVDECGNSSDDAIECLDKEFLYAFNDGIMTKTVEFLRIC